MNKNSFIWVVVILLIIVFVYGGFLLVRKYQATRTLSQNRQQDKILQESFSKKCDFFKTDWNIFDHSRGNFSLKYPNCWVRRNTENDDEFYIYNFLRNDISQFSDSDSNPFRPPYFQIGGGIGNFIDRYRKSVSKKEFTFQNLPAVKEIFTHDRSSCLKYIKEKYNEIDTEFCEKTDLFPNIILVTIYEKLAAIPEWSIIALALAIHYDPNDPMDYSALMDRIVSTLKIN